MAVAAAAVLTAGLYTVMSYGLAIIYGVMKIINLSHAGMMMLGAYAAYVLNRSLGLDPVLSSFLALPLFFVFGVVLYRTMVQRVANAPPIASLLLLFGLWLVIQNVAYIVWGTEDQSIVTPYTYASLNILGVAVPVTRMVVFVVAAAVMGILYYTLNRTYLGKAIRATSQNRPASQLAGIDVDRVSTISFGLGTAFAGFAGSLLTLLYSFNPDFGGVFQLKSFCIIVLGGLESFAGVAAGALVLSVVESFSTLVMRASLQNVIAFGLLVVTLVLLPKGLTGLLAQGRR